MEKEGNLLSVGQPGDLAVLTKRNIKPGFNSKIKPGNVREITLHKAMKIGHPVVERKISDRGRTKGVHLGFQKTTIILEIIQEKDHFLLETETSFYEVSISPANN